MLLALTFIAPMLVVLVLLYVLVRPMPSPLFPLPILAIAALQVVMVSRWIERIEVSLDEDRLRIVAGIARLDIAVAQIDLEHARIVRLDEHPEWKPLFKTGGMSLPGLALGWFRSRARLRLFCVLTDRQRVLVLPTREGGPAAPRPRSILLRFLPSPADQVGARRSQAIVLSLKQPEELLAALRAADDPRVRAR